MPAPRKVAKPAATPAPAAPMPTPASPVVERSAVKGSGTPKVSATAMTPLRTPGRQEIEKRAYEIYAGRGYVAGDPAADWHEAERQLKAGL